jgi:hypothetical protein
VRHLVWVGVEFVRFRLFLVAVLGLRQLLMGLSIAAFIAVAVASCVTCFVAGRVTGASTVLNKAQERAGMTRDAMRLYTRAAKILRRLDGVTELDGDFAADILSPESKKQVSEWLADYRKGLNKL